MCVFISSYLILLSYQVSLFTRKEKTCGCLRMTTREWKVAPQCQLDSSQVVVPRSKALWQSGTRAAPSPSLPRARRCASSGYGGRWGWRRGRGCLTAGSCSAAVPSSPPSSSWTGHSTASSSCQSSLTLTLPEPDLTDIYGIRDTGGWLSWRNYSLLNVGFDSRGSSTYRTRTLQKSHHIIQSLYVAWSLTTKFIWSNWSTSAKTTAKTILTFPADQFITSVLRRGEQ